MRIAIYSANIGNYRNEIRRLEKINKKNEYDYYFFTDDKNLTSTKWNIIYVDLNEELDYIDSNRHTAKFIKFGIPNVLHEYDILIWIDTKCLNELPKLKKYNIEKMINNKNNINKHIYLWKHPVRKTSQEELEYTLKHNVEKYDNGTKFLEEIKDINFKTHLCDSMCMIFKTSEIKTLNRIYDNLMKYKLKRDQNIMQYTFYKENKEDNINYFKFNDLNR